MSKGVCIVVEDHPDMLELLDVYLRAEGYTVATATDGARAIELLSQFKPHAVVTDLMMPTVNGVELIRYLKGSRALKDVPVIVLTAAGDELAAEAQQAGASEIIRKPVDFDSLVMSLGKYLP